MMRSDFTSEHVVITVSDTGASFSDGALAAGVRAVASYSAARGTGLGLAAVRRFVSDRGGQVAIANRESGGACVSLEFPSSLRRDLSDSRGPQPGARRAGVSMRDLHR